MTNPSPPESQRPIKERRKRPATGVTFDEMIAIIVAFSTIGTILFWSMGGKNSKLASNFGFGDKKVSLNSTEAPSGKAKGQVSSSGKLNKEAKLNQELATENLQLKAKLKDLKSSAAVKSSQSKLSSFPNNENKSFSLNSGAKLAPIAGIATIPAFKGGSGNSSGEVPTSNTTKVGEGNNTAAISPETGGQGTDTLQTPTTSEAEVKNTPAIISPENPDPTAEAGADTPNGEKTANQPDKIESTQPETPAITPETTKMPGDVVEDYWAYPFVKQMRDKALVPELARNQEFEPDALITRASMATLVSQAFGGKPKVKSAKKFSDVTNKNAIAKDIDQAVSTGFMQGYSDDEFKPLENIPRYQVLVTLATGLGLKPSKNADQILQQFGDSSNMPDWAKQQVAAATEAGLVVNPPDTKKGSLIPDKPATRAEVAAMIHQALVNTGELKSLKSEYIVKP